jgi:hypothetical protein
MENGGFTPSRQAAKNNARCCVFCSERNCLPFFAAWRLGASIAVLAVQFLAPRGKTVENGLLPPIPVSVG